MGTYTTNKELYKPSVGETGWGTLVNGNFETIDNFLKPITVSGSTYTFTGNQTGGSINATSITNSGTLTSTGKITGNGGIGTKALTATTGTFSGNVTAPNIPRTLLTPLKIYANTNSSNPFSIYCEGVAVYGSSFIASGGSFTVSDATRNISVGANSSITMKWIPYMLINNIPYIFSGDLNISGSWSYQFELQNNNGNRINITNSSGLNKTFDSTNGYRFDITQSEFKSILTNTNIVTITNTTGTGYSYYRYAINMKNNNSGNGYVYISNYDYV